MEDLLRVGVISSAHGIKGEVNVFPTTDEPEMFAHWKTLRLVEKKQSRLFMCAVQSILKTWSFFLLRRLQTEIRRSFLRQAELYITRDQATPCGENENFITDLIGLRVVDENKEELGKCTDVFQTGANDVYEIELLDGRKVLFPAIPSCILNVDLEKGIMTVHVMAGLID